MLRENKSNYYKARVESCKDDPCKLVSLFKELGIKQRSDKSINKIVHDNKKVTDFKKFAELLTTTPLLLWRNMSLTVISNNIHLLHNMSMVKYHIKHTLIFLKLVVNLS